ncbi:acyltransferase family protein [Clostridium saccharoperbutylacetonicum]|uniref:acyltransferase family protein n=1 Tax=Clostridium saccharoperbutylacetonicum TaxID=36745 RepID=UPI0039EC3198
MNKLYKVLGISNDGRLKVLDGIRGIAVLMVFLYHTWGNGGGNKLEFFNRNFTFLVMWGHLGVNLFYVLSGFLLFKPFCEMYYTNSGKIDIKKYFIKRALRILPVYYVFIALSVILTNPNYISTAGLKIILINAFFMQNFFINIVPLLNGVAWTLAIEVQFYILLPLIARFFYGKRNKIALPLTILFVLGYRLLLYVIMKPALTGIDFPFYYATEYNILGCIDNFAIGMTIANIYLYYKNNECSYPKWISINKYMIGILPINIAILSYNYYSWRFGNSISQSALFTFFFDIYSYMSYASLFIYVLFYESKLKKILSSNILRIFGVIGYSVYIWHLPILNYLLNTNFVSKVDGWSKYLHLLILGIIIIIPFSVGMYVFVEKYFIDISSKINLIKHNNKIDSFGDKVVATK